MPSKNSKHAAQQLKKLLAPHAAAAVAAKPKPQPPKGSHEYLVQNPPRFITDPEVQEYWRKWAATTAHTNYGAAIMQFRNHAQKVVDGRSDPVK